MKTEQVNIDALAAAIRIVFNETDLTKLEAVYKTVDAAERKGHVAGFEVGVKQANEDEWETGYLAGIADGECNTATVDAECTFNDGFAAGYEQARRDLGECPTIDADFDDQSVYDWRDFQRDGNGC